MAKKIVLTLALLSLAGCCCTHDVSAEKATLDVVEPAHRHYVESDETLSDQAKTRRLRLLDSWRLRVEEELKAQGGK